MLDVKAAWVVLGLAIAITLVWRWASWPCPAWPVPLLENPYVEAVAGAKTILVRAASAPACACWTRDVGLEG
jgi:hypothetical protein